MPRTAASPNTMQPRLHGELLATCLLAFLKDWEAYGYQLAQRMQAAGLPQSDSGTVYRTLRHLEKGGLVSSFWDTSENGPARRMYALTKAGEAVLTAWIEVLQNYQKTLQQAMGEFPKEVREGVDGAEPALR